jgi:hypothetical protein
MFRTEKGRAIVVTLTKVLASVLMMQLTTVAAADTTNKSDFKVPTPRHETSAISVFTYVAGGPRSRAKRPRLVTDAAVRVKRSNAVILEAKRTTNGHVIFVVKPGVYQVEAAIEPPAATPTIRCGGPQTVRVHKGRKARMKFYCPVP